MMAVPIAFLFCRHRISCHPERSEGPCGSPPPFCATRYSNSDSALNLPISNPKNAVCQYRVLNHDEHDRKRTNQIKVGECAPFLTIAKVPESYVYASRDFVCIALHFHGHSEMTDARLPITASGSGRYLLPEHWPSSFWTAFIYSTNARQ